MRIRRSEFLLMAGGAALGIPALAGDPKPQTSSAPKMPVADHGLHVADGPLDSQRFRAAVVAGDERVVRRMLEQDPALRFSRDDEGRSVFVLAYLAGHPEIAGLFTELGLALGLVEATIAGEWERVEKLGQDAPGLVNAYHPIGGTAMYAAALFGHGVPMFRLNFAGGDPNANPLGKDGVTPVRAAMNCKDPAGAERAATYLIGNDGDVNAPQQDGDSVLHGAARNGNPYLVAYVIRKGGRIDARNAEGHTPLEVAERTDREEAAAVLRRHAEIPRDLPRNDPACSRLAYDANGEPYEPRDLSGHPAQRIGRMVGSAHGNLELVRELADQHSDLVHASATTGEMAVEASAHMAPMTDGVRFLLDRGAPMSLPTCLRLGEIGRARELLRERPARIRERGPHDFALTYYPSIGGGRLESAELLVELGVDVNAEGQLGETGLHWAARADQAELAEFWIEHGADVNARTRQSHSHSPGATPLDYAVSSERKRVAEVLRRNGGRRG